MLGRVGGLFSAVAPLRLCYGCPHFQFWFERVIFGRAANRTIGHQGRKLMSSTMRLLAAGFLLTVATAAGAAELKQVATIQVPGEKLDAFDIGFVDQKTQRYYLADRSNKAVDIFDANTSAFIGRASGFVGQLNKNGKADNAHSGPDGVIIVGDELWAGDGDSTVKVIDLKSMKIVDVISTGGKGRANEMTYDGKDEILIIGNQNEEVPFATMISTKPGHKIIGKVDMPSATDGNEQPGYNPADGLVYQSVPEIDKQALKGAVAVMDPRTAKLVKMLEVENCMPAGIAFGPNDNMVLGCGANGEKIPAIIVIMSTRTGKVVASIPEIGGADMVDYNKRNNQYYVAARTMKGGPVLGVIDAATNKLIQKISLPGGNPHSVASSEANGHVFVPVGASGGDGAVHVYAPQ